MKNDGGMLVNQQKDRIIARGTMLAICAKAWDMARLNMLFVALCIPVVTAPASFAAMTKVIMNAARGNDEPMMSAFWAEFRRNFVKNLAAGLIMAGLAAGVGAAGWTLLKIGGLAGTVGTAVVIWLEVWLSVSFCYLYPLMVTVDIRLSQCFRNAFLLALIEIKTNVILLIPLVLIGACVWFFPFTLPLMLFIVFALCQQMVCSVVGKVIQKRIIDPFNHPSE